MQPPREKLMMFYYLRRLGMYIDYDDKYQLMLALDRPPKGKICTGAQSGILLSSSSSDRTSYHGHEPLTYKGIQVRMHHASYMNCRLTNMSGSQCLIIDMNYGKLKWQEVTQGDIPSWDYCHDSAAGVALPWDYETKLPTIPKSDAFYLQEHKFQFQYNAVRKELTLHREGKTGRITATSCADPGKFADALMGVALCMTVPITNKIVHERFQA